MTSPPALVDPVHELVQLQLELCQAVNTLSPSEQASVVRSARRVVRQALHPTLSMELSMTTPTSQPDSLRKIFTDTFDGVDFTFLTYRGRTAVIARELGAALGYSQRGKRFATQITGRWSREMKEGKHFEVITGPALDLVREALADGTETGPSRIARCLVLFQPGVFLALEKTNKKPGDRLRAWLAERGLPALLNGKAIDADGNTHDPKRVTGGAPANEPMTRARYLQINAASRLVDKLEAAGRISSEVAGRRRLVMLDELMGTTEPSREPPAPPPTPPAPAQQALHLTAHGFDSEEWLSVLQAGRRLGMPGTDNEVEARLGSAISKSGLRGHGELTKPTRRSKRAGNAVQVDEEGRPKSVWCFVYHERALPRLRRWLLENRPAWLGIEVAT